MDTSLNKFISDCGLCSRREADRMIEAGRVTLNGQIAQKGNRVAEGDRVELDGRLLPNKPAAIYLMLNKPKGVTCTTDLKDRANIIDFIHYPQRIFPIGRLDKMSEGLIFLTNDGNIVNKILRAGNGHEKEYVVTTDRPIDAAFVQRMRSGVAILGTTTKPCQVRQEGTRRFRIILTQGLNRQIRRMCEALGYQVTSLRRVRIMQIQLADLPLGHWRHFTDAEVRDIQVLLQHSSKTAEVDGMGE